jgi:hypothetical protein
MASLKDAQALTKRVRERADELHRALADGDVDFTRIVLLADELGDAADRVAATFETIDDAFAERLESGGGASGDDGGGSGSGRSGQQSGSASGRRGRGRGSSRRSGRSGDDAPTRQQLLERAKESGIPRRSEMSKDELIKALAAAGEPVD